MAWHVSSIQSCGWVSTKQRTAETVCANLSHLMLRHTLPFCSLVS